MLRVLLFIILVLAVTFNLNQMLDMKEAYISEYNSRVLTFTYYKVVFDNIVNSGLFDNLYNYNTVLNSNSLFILYILTYYDESSVPYALAITYNNASVYTLTTISYYKPNYNPNGVPGATLNTQALTNLQNKLDELHTNLGINMIVYYDANEVYANQCQGAVKYTFETIYIDNYGFFHLIKITFC